MTGRGRALALAGVAAGSLWAGAQEARAGADPTPAAVSGHSLCIRRNVVGDLLVRAVYGLFMLPYHRGGVVGWRAVGV